MSMSKERQSNFNNVAMLPFSSTVLLVSMRAREDARCPETEKEN
jgi:hypothetical protein